MLQYAERFNELMHQLLAQHASWDPQFFVIHFLDGLREEIRAPIVLHYPATLDTAVSMACTQEDTLEMHRRNGSRRYDPSSVGRSSGRTAFPLLTPPGKTAPPLNGRAEEKRGAEPAKTGVADDRLAALRAYRRSRTLCVKCGDKWFRDHKCGTMVPLHVMEEMLEFLTTQDYIPGPEDTDREPSEAADCSSISQEAVNGSVGPRTMRLKGTV